MANATYKITVNITEADWLALKDKLTELAQQRRQSPWIVAAMREKAAREA